MHRHIPPPPRILAVCKELVHKVVEREATIFHDTRLAVLGEYGIFGFESGDRSNGYAFFAR